VIDELAPVARHVLDQYANNTAEADHGRLKARLRPMRGLKTMRSLRTVAAVHAFVQNLRRGHYEITVDVSTHDRVRAAFTDLARCLYRDHERRRAAKLRPIDQRNNAVPTSTAITREGSSSASHVRRSARRCLLTAR
jgi:hypothetical protein